MPITGGVFTPVWQWIVDAVTNPNMLPARFDTYMNDQATAINTARFKDGSNSPTANLPMAGFVHTGVGNASTRTSYPAVGQIQDNRFNTANDTGTSNTYVMTLSPVLLSYVLGQVFWIRIANSNTGASTLNINGLGAKSIKVGADDLFSGQLLANQNYSVMYDGTNFQLLDISSQLNASATKKVKFDVNALTAQRTVSLQNVDGTMYVSGGQDISVADGGTNISSYAIGDLLYASASTTLSKLARGTANQHLVMDGSGNIPIWADVVNPVVNYSQLTATTSIGVIPFDNTIPQNTEGTQIFSVSYTPRSATSRIQIRVRANGDAATGSTTVALALFIGSNVNASATTTSSSIVTGGNWWTANLEYQYTFASTAAVTFAIRAGISSGSGTVGGSTNTFGGSQVPATMIIQEL